MIELSSQLVFLIIFLLAVATIVIGTLIFVVRVDRAIANENAQDKVRHNEEPAVNKSSADGEGENGEST